MISWAKELLTRMDIKENGNSAFDRDPMPCTHCSLLASIAGFPSFETRLRDTAQRNFIQASDSRIAWPTTIIRGMVVVEN